MSDLIPDNKPIEISIPETQEGINQTACMFFNRSALIGGVAFQDSQLIRRLVFDAIHKKCVPEKKPLTKQILLDLCDITCREVLDSGPMNDTEIKEFKEVVGFVFDSVAQGLGLAPLPAAQIVEDGPKKPGDRNTGQMRLFEL